MSTLISLVGLPTHPQNPHSWRTILPFTIKQTIEKRREFNLETHIAFLDLEKAFDGENRNQVWQILNKRGMPYHLIEVFKSLYKNTSVQMDTGRKILDKIYINPLAPELFFFILTHPVYKM